MTFDFTGAWDAVTGTPLFGITLTVLCYLAAQRIAQVARGNPIANPVLVSIGLVGTVLVLTDVSYADFLAGGQYIAFLLGPAVVALAIPLYREVGRMARSAPTMIVAITLGSAASIASAVLITRAFGGSESLALSMAPKAATAPVAIALSQSIGGVPSLTAVFTILAGILGAVAGPHLLSLLRIRDERIRGLAIGGASHGIGTSRLLVDEPPAAAFSALAMAVNALITALLIPVAIPLMVG